MSIKINLLFKELIDINLIEKGIFIRGIRLFCGIQFKTTSGWTDFSLGIIDTGAPISVIPQEIWESCEVKKLIDYKIQGLVPKKGCSLPVTIGELTCLLTDGQGTTEELFIKAYLAYTNKIPIILGFANLLDKYNVCFNYQQKKAFIEF